MLATRNMGCSRSSGKLNLSSRPKILRWRARLRLVIIPFTRNPSVKVVDRFFSTNQTPQNGEGFRVFSFFQILPDVGYASLGTSTASTTVNRCTRKRCLHAPFGVG